MVDKCKSCGAEIIQAPISKIPFWEGDAFKSRFRWEAFKKENMIWKNMFKVDLSTISFLLIILYIAWAYNADLDQYRDISENPCGFCSGAAVSCSYNKDNYWITGDVPILNNLSIVIDAIKTT